MKDSWSLICSWLAVVDATTEPQRALVSNIPCPTIKSMKAIPRGRLFNEGEPMPVIVKRQKRRTRGRWKLRWASNADLRGVDDA
jgi:hypothetical protein